ncbi:hypothetical protein EIM48_13200 [Pseudoxanthomonas sp. SGNA-20]|uniref:hypothetical protein n=1 Tax=Pseudoxanthomonas sp. SGNA-20 TaxID=2493088 RepID=UPI000F63D6B7|nr:hypothetical protein [Pseudoxanthomonas sp. SGNA-20]RRN54513.1 hypothetical protein EIM48_13200 [Pseudoxanthomonas sp. SGNA-20]
MQRFCSCHCIDRSFLAYAGSAGSTVPKRLGFYLVQQATYRLHGVEDRMADQGQGAVEKIPGAELGIVVAMLVIAILAIVKPA